METMNRKTHQAPMARQVLDFFLWGVWFGFATWGCWGTVAKSVSSGEHTGSSEGPCFSGGVSNRLP